MTDDYALLAIVLLVSSNFRRSELDAFVECAIKGVVHGIGSTRARRRLDPQLLFAVVVPEVEALYLLIIVEQLLLSATLGGGMVRR